MTTPRYRRSSVRAVLETLTHDRAVAAEAHDALWAVLWKRRYDDVDEPLWLPDAAYTGILAFARVIDPETTLLGVDAAEAFLVFRAGGEPPPIGSRVRLLPASRERWRIAETIPLGLGIDLRFDDNTPVTENAWVAPLYRYVFEMALGVP